MLNGNYTIRVYGHDFSAGPISTLHFGTHFYDFSFTEELGKPGGFAFTMKADNPKATVANLTLYNRIIIYKGTTPRFVGYIENFRASLQEIKVEGLGLFGLFKKRLFTGSFSSADAKTSFYSILTTLNSADDTGVVIGNSDVSSTLDDIEFSRSRALTSWEKIADLSSAEFYFRLVDTGSGPTIFLDFENQIGADKSSLIFLRYLKGQVNSATILNFDVDVDGADIVNSVTGFSKDGGGSDISSTNIDATSIATFGKLEDAVNFPDSRSVSSLSTETQEHVDVRKDEVYTPKIDLNLTLINEEDLTIGDTVRVEINNDFIVLSRNDRVLKKTVRVSENNNHEVSVTLQPSGSNLLPSSFVSSIVGIEKRVRQIESNL